MWKKGPLPPDTYFWGGVVVNQPGKNEEEHTGFQFANFHGDHVTLVDGTRVEANDVLFYNNSLTFPIETE